MIAHAHDVLATMRARFPGRMMAIGETGWPSRGRWRRDAVPSLVNQARFVRRFIAFAQAERLDYNLFESFDEVWKYHDEGVVGPSWGLWNVDRTPKYPQAGPVQENARWYVPAGLSVGCAWLLYGLAMFGRVGAARRPLAMAAGAALLGGALGFAWAGTAPVLFDRWVVVAAIGNLSGQAVLALLYMHRLAGGDHPAGRSGRDATRAVRSLLQLRRPAGWTGADAVFDDLSFVFAWTAAVLQVLLVYDPRYRDFPLPTFAVPVVVTGFRLVLRDFPRVEAGREEWVVAGVLVAGAVGSAWREGVLNLQSLGWNACAVLLGVPLLLAVPGLLRRRA